MTKSSQTVDVEACCLVAKVVSFIPRIFQFSNGSLLSAKTIKRFISTLSVNISTRIFQQLTALTMPPSKVILVKLEKPTSKTILVKLAVQMIEPLL